MVSAKIVTLFLVVLCVGLMVEQAAAQWYYPYYGYYWGKRSAGFAPQDVPQSLHAPLGQYGSAGGNHQPNF
ncbi:hypothetical protein AAVH_32778 [Aphelenchoides avenae]|nr:hypothetical protein AAVH_32778 [Aphelenchus avenae]